MSRENAIAGREDVSRFIVHLTRNDKNDFTDGATAKNNFLAILESKKILSVRPHCIFNKRLEKVTDSVRKKFNVACFTEIPLNQLHLIARDIPGRSIKLEAYGFCFTKEFVVKSGGQPAIYINSYGDNNYLRESVDRLYEDAVTDDAVKNPAWRILPYINGMNEKYDFSWEREWRTSSSLKFKFSDLVCLVLPSTGADDIKEAATEAGIAVVSPGWTYEQIVHELATQQRTTKSFWKAFKKG